MPQKRIGSDTYVIVPVFNEQKNIRGFLNKLKLYTKNIIVVDDGSDDKTPEIVSSFQNVHLVVHKKNRGKGSAMKTGASKALKLGGKKIIFMDGDNQHDPRHLPDFEKLLTNGSDIVIGVRMTKAKIPFVRRIGNMIFIYLVKFLFNMHIPDILCGYRGFSKRGLKHVSWSSEGYGVETEMITIIGRKNLPYKTVVVDTIYLDKYKGFSVSGGLRILMKLFYWKIRKI